MAENEKSATANQKESEAAPERALDAIAQGVSPSYGTFSQQTGSSAKLDKQLRAIQMGVLDNQNDPTGEVAEENEEELRARLEAAKKYEELQNAIIEEREKRAEEERKADPAEVEKARLQKKLEEAKEYEEYSNAFVASQNESRVDPVVRNYEMKEAYLSDREPPVEHRLEVEFNKVVREDADEVFPSPTVSEIEAKDRALVQAKEDTELVRNSARKSKRDK